MTTSLINTKPVSAFEIIAARTSLTTGTLFVLSLASLHLLQPELDPTWRFISEYALGRFGWLMTLAFLALAVCLASAGAAVFSQIRTLVGYIGMGVLALGIVGLIIAAIFRTDPISTGPEAMTTSGKMHVLGASLDYSPVAFLLLSLSLARTQAWRPVRKWLFMTAAITLVVTVAFILMIPHNGVFGPGVLAGLAGRFLVLSYLGWVAPVAFHTFRLSRQEKLNN